MCAFGGTGTFDVGRIGVLVLFRRSRLLPLSASRPGTQLCWTFVLAFIRRDGEFI